MITLLPRIIARYAESGEGILPNFIVGWPQGVAIGYENCSNQYAALAHGRGADFVVFVRFKSGCFSDSRSTTIVAFIIAFGQI